MLGIVGGRDPGADGYFLEVDMLREIWKREENRIIWPDIAKGICILFVILSHCYPPAAYRNFFTPFFLTMFFFVSGYFASPKESAFQYFAGKVQHLLIPFLILGGIRVGGFWILEGGDLKMRVIDFLLQISCRGDELWFVSCLFTVSILWYALYWLVQGIGKAGRAVHEGELPKEERMQQGAGEPELMLAGSVCMLVLGILIIFGPGVRLPWELELACIMNFFYTLGYWYRKRENQICIRSGMIFTLGILYLLLITFVVDPADIHREEAAYPMLLFVKMLLVILPFMKITQALEKKKIAPALIFLGQNSLFYFAFSGIVRIPANMLLQKVGIGNPYLNSVLCTAIVAAVLVVPAAFVRRYVPEMVGAKRRKQKN